MAGTLVDFIWDSTETQAYYNSSNLAFLAHILDMINEKQLWLISHEIYPEFSCLIHMSHMPTLIYELLII